MNGQCHHVEGQCSTDNNLENKCGWLEIETNRRLVCRSRNGGWKTVRREPRKGKGSGEQPRGRNRAELDGENLARVRVAVNSQEGGTELSSMERTSQG